MPLPAFHYIHSVLPFATIESMLCIEVLNVVYLESFHRERTVLINQVPMEFDALFSGETLFLSNINTCYIFNLNTTSCIDLILWNRPFH